MTKFNAPNQLPSTSALHNEKSPYSRKPLLNWDKTKSTSEQNQSSNKTTGKPQLVNQGFYLFIQVWLGRSGKLCEWNSLFLLWSSPKVNWSLRQEQWASLTTKTRANPQARDLHVSPSLVRKLKVLALILLYFSKSFMYVNLLNSYWKIMGRISFLVEICGFSLYIPPKTLFLFLLFSLLWIHRWSYFSFLALQEAY